MVCKILSSLFLFLCVCLFRSLTLCIGIGVPLFHTLYLDLTVVCCIQPMHTIVHTVYEREFIFVAYLKPG